MNIEIGDYIIFKAQTRDSFRKVRRKVNGFYNGMPTVGYFGSCNFVVRYDEIIEVAA